MFTQKICNCRLPLNKLFQNADHNPTPVTLLLSTGLWHGDWLPLSSVHKHTHPKWWRWYDPNKCVWSNFQVQIKLDLEIETCSFYSRPISSCHYFIFEFVCFLCVPTVSLASKDCHSHGKFHTYQLSHNRWVVVSGQDQLLCRERNSGMQCPLQKLSNISTLVKPDRSNVFFSLEPKVIMKIFYLKFQLFQNYFELDWVPSAISFLAFPSYLRVMKTMEIRACDN